MPLLPAGMFRYAVTDTLRAMGDLNADSFET